VARGAEKSTDSNIEPTRSMWLDAGPALYGLGFMVLLPSVLLFCLFFAGGPRGQRPLVALPWNHPLVIGSDIGLALSVALLRAGLVLMRKAARLSSDSSHGGRA
jgi:hypothetical protein